MNEHRHIIIEGEELYHYGVKGMKWKNHVYAVAKKAGDAASKFAKKANEMKERLTPAAKVARGKARAALKRVAKKYAEAAKNKKKAIQDAKFESMKKRTEAARRKPGKAPSKDQMHKIFGAKRDADVQVARENLVDVKSRGRIKDPRNTAETINLMKSVTGTANYNRSKHTADKYNKYYSDAKKQMDKKKERDALAARVRSQKVGRRKPKGR